MTDLDKWVKYLKDDDKSDNTIESYQRDVEQFMDFIQKEVEDINKEDIDNYKNEMKANKMVIKTINRKLVSINSYFTFLNNELDENINLKIKQEKLQKQDYLDEMLSKEDFDKLVEAARSKNDLRAVTIFYTLFMTGARVSELLQIQLQDINEDTILIKGKGNKHRNVFISDKLKEILNQYIPSRYDSKSPLLFTGERGPINRQTVHKIIKHYAVLANVKESKAHAHNFRHLYCLTLIDRGLSIDTVADLAGHSDINTTRIYTRKTKKELLDTINNL